MKDKEVIETLNDMKGVFGERGHSQYSLYAINRAIAAIEKQGEEMKNKINRKNLMNTYYYEGTYELHFVIDNKDVYLKNIKAKDYPEAEFDEWFFDDENVLEKIIKNVDENDIEITEEIKCGGIK